MNIRSRPILLTVASVAFAYVVSFGCTFELFGDPVRSESGAWLGPPKRINPEITDIGKIYVYHGTKMFAYRFYYPLCIVWSRLMGLQ